MNCEYMAAGEPIDRLGSPGAAAALDPLGSGALEFRKASTCRAGSGVNRNARSDGVNLTNVDTGTPCVASCCRGRSGARRNQVSIRRSLTKLIFLPDGHV